MATSTWSPTAVGTNGWTNLTYAYTSNDSRATATPGKSTDGAGIWKTYGITDPAAPSTISKVEIGAEWSVDTTASIFTLRVRASYDNGSNWTNYVDDTGEQTSESLVWYDVTDGRAWTWAELGNANFLVDVTASQGNSKTAVTCSLDHCPVRVTYEATAPCEVYAAEAILDYNVPITPCEVYAAEAILDYEVPPCEVYAAEAILNYVAPAEVYAAETILDYNVHPCEVYAAEAILDYTAPAEVYAAEAILDYEQSPAEVYAAEVILDYTAPAEVYAAEAILDYEVPPCEVYAAEAILDYVSPAEVYAAEAILDYEVPPCEIYAAEAILDYTAPAEVYAAESILDYIAPTEVYASETILDYTAPCEVYATEVVLDYAPPSTGGGSPGRFAWPLIPTRKTPEELKVRRARKLKTIHVIDDLELTDEATIGYKALVVADDLYLDDHPWLNKQLAIIDDAVMADFAFTHKNMTLTDRVHMEESLSIFATIPDRPVVLRERPLERSEELRAFARPIRASFLRRRLIRAKDPSLTAKVESAYAGELDKLFLAFKRDAAKILGMRELSDDWDEIDAPDLMDKFERTIEVTITIPGTGIVRRFTTRAYTAGGLRSTQFLNSLGVKAVFSILPADRAALDILITRDLSGLKGITDEMSKQIMAEITDGMLRGDSMATVARAIDDRIDSIGRTRATMLARTETMKAFNEGSLTQYDKHGITEVEWLASPGERTCDECMSYDGQKFSMDEHPDCPAHPNCRCVLLPVIPEI